MNTADFATIADPLLGADCHFCGRTADNFHVPDDVWAKVEPVLGQNQACFRCFRVAAWEAGFRDGWEVTARAALADAPPPDRTAMRDLAGLVLERTSQDSGPADCEPFTGWCVDLARDVLTLLNEKEAA